ncbi:MAG: MYG1 family protein [Proteobacteria bacterium]|nr:MYG1 family protein [Pseudomonadota bacterium]
MTVTVATHSGPFHADDVLAWTLLCCFVDADARLVRTRDPAELAKADIVLDVGGIYDPSKRRFDHHQSSYAGPLSSAGMVLTWLADDERIDRKLAQQLRLRLVDYGDAVDNGVVAPRLGVPCFPNMVRATNQLASEHAEFDKAFLHAAKLADVLVRGIVAGFEAQKVATALVLGAMKNAEEAGRAVMFMDRYCNWKEIYFAHGGESHPTDYVIHPATDGSWRIVCIPPKEGDFGQKKPLPLAWAGLSNAELSNIVGVDGAVFCHKNRFIAVFETREAAIKTLEIHGMMYRANSE